jgi:ketosteroid isomerase-like protein
LYHKIQQSYLHGERGYFAEVLDEDVQWTVHGPSESFPIPNRMRGKAEVLAALAVIDEQFEILNNVPTVVMVDGDRVAVICERTVRQRASGRTLRYTAAGFQRYRNGRLVEYQGFMDSYELCQQGFARQADPPDGAGSGE